MKDGYCENCLNPAECYLSGRCWPPHASTNPDAKIEDALASESEREAAGTADEKPDGQAENAGVLAHADEKT